MNPYIITELIPFGLERSEKAMWIVIGAITIVALLWLVYAWLMERQAKEQGREIKPSDPRIIRTVVFSSTPQVPIAVIWYLTHEPLFFALVIVFTIQSSIGLVYSIWRDIKHV